MQRKTNSGRHGEKSERKRPKKMKKAREKSKQKKHKSIEAQPLYKIMINAIMSN